ncbi:hypothetical protein PR048_031493 [Dryococelus australis]|uniref:Uncharacterized protein n=1 Tax=Dryococelus australis TaxID=614101 RepID=A0ABQ9G5G0_9NEOP|nr:hypothetical protein PR048_031493 [Dryococelus australis]
MYWNDASHQEPYKRPACNAWFKLDVIIRFYGRVLSMRRVDSLVKATGNMSYRSCIELWNEPRNPQLYHWSAGFLVDLPFPPAFFSVLLHTDLTSPPSAIKTIEEPPITPGHLSGPYQIESQRQCFFWSGVDANTGAARARSDSVPSAGLRRNTNVTLALWLLGKNTEPAARTCQAPRGWLQSIVAGACLTSAPSPRRRSSLSSFHTMQDALRARFLSQLASPCTRKIGPALSPHFVQDVPCTQLVQEILVCKVGISHKFGTHLAACETCLSVRGFLPGVYQCGQLPYICQAGKLIVKIPLPPPLNSHPTILSGDRGADSGCSRFVRCPSRVRLPARSLPKFPIWESCRAMSLFDGFSRGSSATPAPSVPALLYARLVSPSSGFTLISRPNLSTLFHFIRPQKTMKYSRKLYVNYTQREYSSCSELFPPHSMHVLQRRSMWRSTSLMANVFFNLKFFSCIHRSVVHQCFYVAQSSSVVILGDTVCVVAVPRERVPHIFCAASRIRSFPASPALCLLFTVSESRAIGSLPGIGHELVESSFLSLGSRSCSLLEARGVSSCVPDYGRRCLASFTPAHCLSTTSFVCCAAFYFVNAYPRNSTL